MWVQAIPLNNRFRLTKNTNKVAVQLADRWAKAVEAQVRRTKNPENLRVTVLMARHCLRLTAAAYSVLPAGEFHDGGSPAGIQ
jgi:hypothetical protein